MIDPLKKARDADRDAAIEVVEAAFADGQISRPDYDLRVDRLLNATTVGDVESLVRDLQPRAEDPEASRLAPLAPQPPEEPGVSRLASLAPQPPAASLRSRLNLRPLWIVGAVIGAVIALGAVVPLVIFSSVEGGGGVESGVIEVGELADLTTAVGYDVLLDAVEEKTGSRTVFNATIYPGYAVIEVPVDGNSQRSFGYYFDGGWRESTGKGTAMEERFDLERIDGKVVERVVEQVKGRVEDPTSSYVIVNSPGRDQSVCLSAYATNDFSETAYLDARCNGKVVFAYASE